MDYDSFAQFARSFGLLYLMALFLVVCVYALWPRNQEKFERAAQMPLDKDDA